MSTVTVDSVYNPGQLSKEDLIQRFVVRHKKFSQLFKEIKDAKMETPEQHLLIVGQRGMGKTTLLLRLAYEVQNDTKLNSWVIPVIFSEEQYAIRKLYNLWEETAKYLEESIPEFSGLFDRMDSQYKSEIEDEKYEEIIFELLINELEKNGKKIIIFMDNLQDFLKKLSKQESQRLREILSTSSHLRLISASPISVEAVYDYKHPLYEQFKTYYLEGLNTEETQTVLKMLGKHYDHKEIDEILAKEKGRIQALRQITGGVIRTTVLLFEFFLDDRNGSVFKDLERILDRVTTLYKDRTDDLPKNQQVIIDAIALSWDAISTKEIAQKTRLESKVVSAQLAQLAKNDWIEVVPTNTKNHLYRLKERFYNIWYLMRYGRKSDGESVKWLVKFFKEWYDGPGLEGRLKNFIAHYREGRYEEKHAKMYFTVLANSELGLRKNIIKKYPELIQKWGIIKTEIPGDTLEESPIPPKKSLSHILNEAEAGNHYAWLILGIMYEDDLNNYHKAEECYLKAIEKGINKAFLHLGILHHELKNYDKAEKYYLKAIEHKDYNAYLGLLDLYINEFKRYKLAEKLLIKISKLNFTNEKLEFNKGDVYNELGLLYRRNLKNYKKSKFFFERAIEEECQYALTNLGLLLMYNLKDFKEAETILLKASKFAYEEEFIDQKGEALNALGDLYRDHLYNPQLAKSYYEKAIAEGNQDALLELGDLLMDELNLPCEAEKILLKATEFNYDEDHSENKGDALNSLGDLYYDYLVDFDKAKFFYEKAIENGSSDSDLDLAILLIDEFEDFNTAEKLLTKSLKSTSQNNSLKNGITHKVLGDLYSYDLKRYNTAEKCYLQSIEEGNQDALLSLGFLYYFYINKPNEGKKYLSKGEKYLQKIIKSNPIKENDHKIGHAFFKLGNLYQQYYQNFKKSEQYYLNAIDANHLDSHGLLADLYFDFRLNKEKALFHAQFAWELKKDPMDACTLGTIQLWNNNYKEAISISQYFLFDKRSLIKITDELKDYLLLAIAKNQYDFVYDYFTGEKGKAVNSKDRFKPIWYALMHYMKDKYPNEYLRMGPELQETVDEIIAKIEQMRKDYA